MKIAIINTLPVPSGNASVNRFLSYSKGLVSLGMDVTILSSAYSENNTIGEIDGIHYYCFGKSGNSIVSLLGALHKILKNIRKQRYDAIILVSNSLYLIYPVAILCSCLHIKLLQEKSEYPFVLLKKDFLHKIWARFYISTTYKIFDGLIVMTKPLMEYFSDKVSSRCRMIEVPMTVDVDRFHIEKVEDVKLGEYIAYCGDMAGNKDGVENLINAFSFIEKKYPKINLVLIGGSSNEQDFIALKQLVHNLNLSNVIFYGRVNREQIPQLLKNAKILALARPSSLQSLGGFPTKLGEYLSTGNPVVVTAVGDIPLYLNKVNSYIVAPNDNIAFADRIDEILSDYEHAKIVGQEGMKVANTIFNAKLQSERLFKYLKELV